MIDPFSYRKPDDEQIIRIQAIRTEFLQALETVQSNTNPGPVCGRYVALAKTALEESAMWAIKAIVFEGESV